ncbi:NAD-dependent epimerase/dehydratase family protein [Pseudomonas sp. NW5]|uniref:NAD-dependent epimerase/dehydratase family protein n=1 Tax=Pseudomonas sp. NW5 TaxID=2934934 RepID=UPI0020223B11|nr:NAD-dependent epimerase/dehydratase family protein [Pseudomonas sp. NW5]MCL7463091.1 NAD-dependent epimerase/dehydratase family protein [Pseudomonas sp. NW5]
MSRSVVIVGCGDVGSRLGQQLLAAGWCVYGLRRNVAALPAGLRPVAADLREAACPAQWPEQAPDYLVYCATPDGSGEAAYRAAYVEGLRHVLGWLAARQQRPRRVLFVSSTGVYGQQAGEWVDEASPCAPQAYNGRILLEAEALAQASGLPATAVRLAGIYGPGRTWLLDQVRAGYRPATPEPLYGNRIHADDAAALLAFLLQQDAAGVALADCYLGVDDAPSPLLEVVDWLRERLGVTQVLAQPAPRRGGSKRCSNARARALGWVPRYPDYRAGYAALLGPV